MRIFLVNGSELVALVCWLMSLRAKGALFLLLGLQLALVTIIDASAALADYGFEMETTLLYNLYIPIEMLLVGGIVLVERPDLRRFAWPACVGLMATWGAELGYVHFAEGLTIISLLLIAMFTCAGCAMVLWTLANTTTGPLVREPRFWLFLGLVVYFGGIAPLISSINYLNGINPQVAADLFWIVQVLCAIRYSLAGAACLLWRSQQRTVIA